jgi:ribosomal protein S18 acetylase RimI-like enzyme
LSEAWQVRKLVPADLSDYRKLRLTALAAHPEAFGSSWEEEAQFDDCTFVQRMTQAPPSVALGGFSGPALVGTASMVVQPRVKQRHKGTIYGVYVDPWHRGSGLAQGLMEALLAEARHAGLLLLQLSVTVGNRPARRLYAGLGFQTYGIERRALKLGEAFVDEELMALDLA